MTRETLEAIASRIGMAAAVELAQEAVADNRALVVEYVAAIRRKKRTPWWKLALFAFAVMVWTVWFFGVAVGGN